MPTPTDAPSVPILGIQRHRIATDGAGVTTLVGFHGCPLHCRYCLNPQCHFSADSLPHFTPRQLLERVSIDNLYFLATGGGICFGGGEPLTQSRFIQAFRALAPSEWHFTAETSLWVSQSDLLRAIDVIDDFIVDIKDCSPSIYRRYTDLDNTLPLSNLQQVLLRKGDDHLVVRVPSIPDYNTPDDVAHSIDWLHSLGITHIDQFTYQTQINKTV